jgi:hypothetical protein
MSEETSSATPPPVKPKRKMSPEQLANLARGREKAAAARASKLVASTTAPGEELDGQRLVKVERQPYQHEAPRSEVDDDASADDDDEFQGPIDDDSPPARVSSIEDILARSNQRQRRQLDSNADSAAETRAEREVEEYTSAPAVPPEESRPERRDAPSIGAVQFREGPPDLSTSQQPRTLADLTRYLDTSGNYEIDVTRKAPRMYGSVPCAGSQRPIRGYMTMSEFAEQYGGGDYELILYGPPRRGGIFDPKLGKMRPVALTDPVRVTVPHHYPPNLEAGVLDDLEEEEEDMQRFGPGLRRGPATAADAKIFETSLQHEERMTDRQRDRERELEERLHSMPAQMKPFIDSVRTTSEKMVDVVREESQRREELLRENAEQERLRAEQQAREVRGRPTELGAMADMVTKMVNVMRPQEGKEAHVIETASRERENLVKLHQDEVRRITETMDARIRDANARADDRIRDIEARADRRVQEAEQRAERSVREAKDEVARQIADVTRVYEARIKDEERNHERELRARESSNEVRVESLRTASEMRIAAKDDEVKRLQGELDRLRHDLAEVKDLPTQVEKFKSTATTLGFVQASEQHQDEDKEPPDWKSMVGQIGLNLVSNLPNIIQSASDSVTRMRAQQQQPQQVYSQMQGDAYQTQPRQMAGGGVPALRGPGGQPFVPRRLAFATEDGPEYVGGPPIQPPPRYPGQAPQAPGAPPGAPPVPPAPLQGAQQPLAPAPLPPQAPLQVAPPMPPPQPAMQPLQPVLQQAAPPPPAASAAVLSLPKEQLAQIRLALEGAFEQAESVDEVAQSFIQQLGAPTIGQVVANISAEQVIATVQAQPDGATSPLVRREGQKFVRALWESLKQRVGMG